MQSTSGFEPNDNDARIMLQMLLSEARRFHASRDQSLRKPSCPTRPALESSTNSSISNGSVCSLRSSSTSTPPPQFGGNSFTSAPNPYDSPTASEGGETLYDGWSDLQSQIEDAWVADSVSSPTVKYQRIKSYLTCLFIWDPTREWEDFEDASPAASLQWISVRQQSRLAMIPAGQLFATVPDATIS